MDFHRLVLLTARGHLALRGEEHVALVQELEFGVIAEHFAVGFAMH